MAHAADAFQMEVGYRIPMRFLADGPMIPGDLITAHDEGRVILFCGSGVSRAYANLPDFMGLAGSVLDGIGSAPGSRARKVKEAAENAPKIEGLGALIAADTIFSQLEDDFPIDLIQRQVARALLKPDADLAAHRTLLDLARGPDGRVRLVTTNFDRLFQACDSAIETHVPPDLPDPSRADLFQGVIHLHGMVTADYDGAVCPAGSERGFVLSAADFGAAYLVHGWAAQFIRRLIAEYQILFVGYSADDPPVRYLLEALGGGQEVGRRLYAFQEGDDDHARALWGRKGVEAICYDPANGHRTLWETLSAWAERARDPDGWHAQLLEEASAGPRDMLSHRRGQIAHLAMSRNGARRLASAGAKLPAEWICVFDPHCRYRPPPRSLVDDTVAHDPFDLLCIDSDPPPERDPDDLSGQKRVVPKDAWSAFAVTELDGLEVDPASVAEFFGNAHQQRNLLPPRHAKLAEWFASVAHQPMALWWAAGMIGLHPDIAWEITRQTRADPDRFPVPVRQGWQTLLDVRAEFLGLARSMPLYDIAGAVKRDGWSRPWVREFAASQIPTRKIGRGWHIAEPPAQIDDWRELFDCNLEYAWYQDLPAIPDEHIPLYARQLFQSLEIAVDLERDFHRFVPELGAFTPQPEDDEGGAPLSDLTALFRRWLAAMEQWALLDAVSVRAFITTLTGYNKNFALRARLWSCCQPGLLDAQAVGAILAGLDDEAFWDYDHQRDLIHTIARAWATLAEESRRALETRLLSGPPRHDQEDDADYERRSAWSTLIRIGWLANQGCIFGFDYEAETEKRIQLLPEWNTAYLAQADHSNESRAYSIITDNDPTSLTDIPLNQIIEHALKLGGRDPVDWRKERDPFAGLVNDRPARALATLRRHTGTMPTSYWSSLLWSERRKDDHPRMVSAIAAVLLELPDDRLAVILNPVSVWFRTAHVPLEQNVPTLCSRLWDRLLDIMEKHPEHTRSGLVRRRNDRDWIGAALNAPAGRLTELTLLRSGPSSADGQINDVWLERMRRLLTLAGDAGGHALVYLARNIDFLFSRAPAWVETSLFPFTHNSGEQRVIFWLGRFWFQRGLSTAVFVRLRDELLALVSERRSGREWNMALAIQVLLGWHDEQQHVAGKAYSDVELRSAILAGNDEFRRQVLHTLQGWLGEQQMVEAALHLVADIWPRQFSARSEGVIKALVNLMFATGDNFPRFVIAGLELLQPLGGQTHLQPSPEATAKLAMQYSDAMLDLLTSILPTDPRQWPYGIDVVLSTISASGCSSDRRLVRLQKQRMDSR